MNGEMDSFLFFNCLKRDASTGLLCLIAVIQINKVISLICDVLGGRWGVWGDDIFWAKLYFSQRYFEVRSGAGA